MHADGAGGAVNLDVPLVPSSNTFHAAAFGSVVITYGGLVVIPAEVRSVTPGGEDRSSVLTREDRNYQLTAEDRLIVLPAEDRLVVVPRAA